MIHETALVSKKAKLGKEIKIGPFAIIEDDVEIGDNCEIGPKVHVIDGARLGSGNYIGEGTIISDRPQDLKYKGEKTQTIIGNDNVIREYVTIHRSTQEGKATIIGNNNFLMGLTHIAHDCVVGNNIVIVNYTGLTGHVRVDDHAFISGFAAIHQNVRIGAHAMVGGGVRVSKDVAPFVMVSEDPLKTFGLNLVGLKRKGFTSEKIKVLKDLYKIFFDDKLLVKEAIDRIRKELPSIDEVKYFIDFVQNSKRGITR